MGELLLKGTAIEGDGEVTIDLCGYKNCKKPVNRKYEKFCSRKHQNAAYNQSRPRKTERRKAAA